VARSLAATPEGDRAPVRAFDNDLTKVIEPAGDRAPEKERPMNFNRVATPADVIAPLFTYPIRRL